MLFLLPSGILLYGSSTTCLSTHLFGGIVSGFGPLRKKLLKPIYTVCQLYLEKSYLKKMNKAAMNICAQGLGRNPLSFLGRFTHVFSECHKTWEICQVRVWHR